MAIVLYTCTCIELLVARFIDIKCIVRDSDCALSGRAVSRLLPLQPEKFFRSRLRHVRAWNFVLIVLNCFSASSDEYYYIGNSNQPIELIYVIVDYSAALCADSVDASITISGSLVGVVCSFTSLSRSSVKLLIIY